MKICDLIAELERCGSGADYSYTCDTVKTGDPEKPLRKLAVTMMPTVKVLTEAAAWGADLLVVHEPLYYQHFDSTVGKETDPVIARKKQLVDGSGMVVYRYHDHMHHHTPDLIYKGEMGAIGLSGTPEPGIYAITRYRLDTPMTSLEMAAHLEKTLGIAHIRVIGDTVTPMRRISCCFGATGHLTEELCSGEEMVLAGEIDEWCDGEYFRDAAELGIPAALLVLGHVGSERDGMQQLAKDLAVAHPEIEIRYFESGEVYTYTDREGT